MDFVLQLSSRTRGPVSGSPALVMVQPTHDRTSNHLVWGARHACRTLLREALTDGIGSRGMNWRFEDRDRARFRHTSKARPKLALMSTHQLRVALAHTGWLPAAGRATQAAGGEHVTPTWITPLDAQFYDTERLRAVERRERSRGSASQAQIGAAWVREIGLPRLTSWLVGANVPHVLAVWCACPPEGPVSAAPHESFQHPTVDYPSPSA